MSILGRIRQNIALIAIIIFVALLAFVLTDFIRGITTIVSGPLDAGYISGEPISQEEFNRQVNQAVESRPGQLSEADRGRLEDQVWQQVVTQKILEQEYKKSGVDVSSAELSDMLYGRNIDAELIQAPIFKDSLGRFDPSRVKLYFQQIAQQSPDQFVQNETYFVGKRRIDKYFYFLTSGYTGSKELARQQYMNRNKTVDLQFLAVNYTAVSDSDVNVSDSELRSYMQEKSYLYEQDPQTTIRYVKFDVIPNSKDSAKSFQSLVNLKERFAAKPASSDSAYMALRSRTPYTRNFLNTYELPAQIQDSVAGQDALTVFGPVQVGADYQLIKLSEVGEAETPSVKASHILIRFGQDTAAAESKARGFLSDARSGDFAAVATANSEDFATKTRGGALGWYRKGQFGEDFDKAVERAGVGSVVGPIKGNQGYHIVKIEAKDNRTYNIAQIEDVISYTTPTRDSVFSRANAFAKLLLDGKDINTAANEMNEVARESDPLTNESRTLRGINGGREVIIWALNADIGDKTPKVIRVGDTYVLAQVQSRSEEGLQNLDDVRAAVETAVRNRKKAEIIKQKLAGQQGQTLDQMRSLFPSGAFVNTATGISFESTSIPGIGQDYYVLGRALALAEGNQSEPIEGANGVYVVQTTKINQPTEPDDATLESLKTTAVQTGLQQLNRRLDPALKDAYEVDDNRARVEARQFGYN
ncbi:MAG: SurA N-terminal domain-containing protein [Bacteroidota bacterium]